MISGEYHHIDYKEKRRNQLQKEQQIRNSSAKHLSHQTDKTNCYITMAKAVHFRALSHCFILDGIDISPRFQYDRNILRDACLRFHSYV
jgi:chloramphenicol O-acetyltransferase